MMNSLLLNIIAFPSVLAVAKSHCPPTGPVFITPQIPNNFNPLQLSQKLEGLLNNRSLSWNSTTTSFSVGITSINETVFEKHHTASLKDAKGVHSVDSNTVYRVASITKVFNVLSLLVNAETKLDTAIGTFIPELHGVEAYEGITLRMLASQMAGVPRDGNAFDMYTEEGDMLLAAGFPKPPSSDIPSCDTVVKADCSRSEFFSNLLRNNLTWLPADRIAYSDQAYTLLGFALERITGKTFSELLKQSITGPLHLSSTGIEAPQLSRAIIPAGEAGIFMGLNIGNFNATAGLYSTPADLLAFMRSILSHALLSPVRTRQWLKPSGFAGAFSMARPVDVYAKSGDLPGYAAYVAVLPDYNIGFTIQTAGPAAYDASVTLLDVVTTSLVPALDELARDQTKKSLYTGRYAGRSGGSLNASLTLDIDDGPGLKVVEWSNGGNNTLKALASLSGTTVDKYSARLYPIGAGNRWRLFHEVLGSAQDYPSAPSGTCVTWMQVDQMRYAGLPVDEFDFILKQGVVTGVKNLGLRADLTRDS